MKHAWSTKATYQVALAKLLYNVGRVLFAVGTEMTDSEVGSHWLTIFGLCEEWRETCLVQHQC
jgi:hypothetical protein